MPCPPIVRTPQPGPNIGADIRNRKHSTVFLEYALQTRAGTISKFYPGHGAFKSIFQLPKGPFKYYVIKEVGGWGPKMTIFADLEYNLFCRRWVGLKKGKNMLT